MVAFTVGGETPTLSDGVGAYVVQSAPGNCSLVPHASGNRSSAIQPADALLILEARVGLASLGQSQQLAADVSGNGAVSAYDAALVGQLAVGGSDPLPAAVLCGSDWIFLPAAMAALNQSTADPLLTSGSCSMGVIEFAPLTGPAAGQDFVGVLLGDVDLSWPGAVP